MPPYSPLRPATRRILELRGLPCQVLRWDDGGLASPEHPALVLLHGWMDVAASFQFLVDGLRPERPVLALDWRGFGGSARAPGGYWFPDYLADLEALLDALLPGQPVDLLGHSMGGNVAMLYAGVRPARVRRLVNLEGFGLPASTPAQAPQRYADWLDQLETAPSLRDYASLDEVAARLRSSNPRLAPERAAWLAPHWAREDADGRWRLLGDPAHKRTNPVLYRAEEALACWARIEAPVLWVEGAGTDMAAFWGERYTRAEFEQRLAVVPRLERTVIDGAGHMLHHDQPEALAQVVERFLEGA